MFYALQMKCRALLWKLARCSRNRLFDWLINCAFEQVYSFVSRFGLKQKDLGSVRFGSPLSSKVVVCGHCLVTLPLTINEILKRVTSLAVLMQKLIILVLTA